MNDVNRFISKAAIRTSEDQINTDGSPANPWILCPMQKVEELKCVIRVMPVWIALVVFYVTLIQQQTYVVFQALQSDRRLGSFRIPAASYTIFTMIGLTVWIPIYDRLLVPWLQKVTKKEGGITILQRLGLGILLSVVTMILSGMVEQKRRELAISNPIGIEEKRGAISPLSASWLIPQLTLIGLAEAFTVIGQVEFYYKQFPENLRSLAGSLTFVGIAGSNYLNSLLITVVHKLTDGAHTKQWLPEDLNKGRLDYFYYLVAAIEIINLGYFLVCAKWYKYKGTGGAAPEIGLEQSQSGKHMV